MDIRGLIVCVVCTFTPQVLSYFIENLIFLFNFSSGRINDNSKEHYNDCVLNFWGDAVYSCLPFLIYKCYVNACHLLS